MGRFKTIWRIVYRDKLSLRLCGALPQLLYYLLLYQVSNDQQCIQQVIKSNQIIRSSSGNPYLEMQSFLADVCSFDHLYVINGHNASLNVR